MGTVLLFILTLLGVFSKSFILYPWKCSQNIMCYCDNYLYASRKPEFKWLMVSMPVRQERITELGNNTRVTRKNTKYVEVFWTRQNHSCLVLEIVLL